MVAQDREQVPLPAPRLTSEHSIETMLLHRRSRRDFKDAPIDLADLGQLLWAAQGLNGRRRGRTAPSAGALYPLELYVVVGQANGLATGTYHYDPKNHRLEKTGSKDLRKPLARAAWGQDCVRESAVVIVFGAVVERTATKYGERAERYVHMEVGHAAQNVYLQAEALDLGTVMVGAFSDNAVARTLSLPGEVEPFALMPVGRE